MVERENEKYWKNQIDRHKDRQIDRKYKVMKEREINIVNCGRRKLLEKQYLNRQLNKTDKRQLDR